jgi:hypothetical protein
MGGHSAEMDALYEWRESIGQRLMLAMTCNHGSDYFGPGAVCDTCFANVQRVGRIIEKQAAHAWGQGRAAERRDWEFTTDLTTPDDERRPWPNPYRERVTPPGSTGDA